MAVGLDIRAPTEQTEGTRSQVLRWLKAVGDTVAENEPVIELETDKVTVEVASPGPGVLQEILKQEQEEVTPGEVLGRIGAGASTTVASDRSGVHPRAGTAGTAGTAGVAGEMAACSPPSSGAQSSLQSGGAASRMFSPAVKRLLAEHDVDAATIRGSGEGGRITVQDVLVAVGGSGRGGSEAGGNGLSSGAGGHAVGAGAAIAVAEAGAAGTVTRVPHTVVRKRIAEHMVRSLLHTAPHVTTVFEADMTAVLDHRAEHRDEYARTGAPLTMTAYFIQAAVAGIRAVPEINSRWTETELEIFDSVHLGVATALDEELLVPVLRNADKLSLFETARELQKLVTRARERQLTPADMRGGTFTISNHGVSGSLLATPIIINQPQSAILGVGRLEKRVIIEEDQNGNDCIAVQPRCYVTLTIDHRVLDGHRANRFLQAFVDRLGHWPT